MDHYCECAYPIGTRSVDERNHCRPYALLAYLQEAATTAAVELKVSREELLVRHNVFWMLARIWFRLDQPLGWDDQLTIRTWHRGGKGVTMYRDFDLYVDGVLVGEAVSAWVLADQDSRKMLRLSQIGEFKHSTGGSLCKDRDLHKIQLPQGLTLTESRLMRYSDTDINGHVNNARYGDFIYDALAPGCFDGGRYISSMQVSYLGECRPGERLELYTGAENGVQFIHGLGEDQSTRFDACVALRKAPWQVC